MSLNLHVIHAKDFIRTTQTGHLDFAQTQKTLAAVARAARGLEDYEILFDVRQVQTVNLTLAQVWQLAHTLIDYGPVFRRKMAILISPDAPGDRARFFEVCAQNRGFDVRAFDDFEQAIYWLAPSIEQKPPGENAGP